MNRTIATLACAGTIAVGAASLSAATFFDRGPATRFVETEVHLMGGGSTLLQNYEGCFPQVRELNISMGRCWGVGATAEFGLRNYLALGAQLNITVNNSRLDMAVSNNNSTLISNIFLQNRACYMRVPVYMSMKFNLASSLRWNVDLGLYYAYGIGGSQKQTIFNSMVNDLGDLINNVYSAKPGYFNNSSTFINGFKRSDIGIHFATGLTIARHYRIGVEASLGLKNVSFTDGVRNPNIHNASVMAVVGYRF